MEHIIWIVFSLVVFIVNLRDIIKGDSGSYGVLIKGTAESSGPLNIDCS